MLLKAHETTTNQGTQNIKQTTHCGIGSRRTHPTYLPHINLKCKLITKTYYTQTHQLCIYNSTLGNPFPMLFQGLCKGVWCLPDFFSTFLATIYLILKRVTSQSSRYTQNNQNPPIVMLVCTMYLVRFNIHVICNLSS
jgi:hypothetical protein